jgi:hypothetical protein
LSFSEEHFSSQYAIKNQKIKNYTVILCGSEWVRNLVSHFKKHTFRMFQNKMLRKIYGMKKDKEVNRIQNTK